MSNPEKFTPKKIYEELNEKWKHQELLLKGELTSEEKKQLDILKKLQKQIDNTGNDTEAKLAKLKEEFTSEEETMIRKAINGEGLNTGIGEIFDEKNYNGLIDSVGASVSEGKDKLEETIKKGGWKAILAKFSGASKIFSEVSEKEGGGFTGLIAGIVAAWEFFMGKGKKEEEKKQENKENKENEKKMKQLKFIGVLNILEKISGIKDPKISAIVKQENFYRHSFNDIEKNYNAGIASSAKAFDLEKEATDEQVYKTLEFVIKNEKFINNILKGKNWKTWSLEKVFGELDKESTILTRLSKLSLEDLKKADFGNLGIKKTENGIEIKGDLKDKLEKSELKNISKITLLSLYYDEQKFKFDNKEELEKTRNLLEGILKNDSNNKKYDAKEIIDKIINFGKKIEKIIIKDFSLGAEKDFSDIFKNTLTTKEIIDFYLITGGETDIKNLNSIQKSTMFLKIWKMLGKRGQYSKRGKIYDGKLIEELKNESSTMLSPEVKTLLGNVFLKAAKETFEGLGNAMKEIWHSLDTKTTIAIGVFLAGAGVLTFYSRGLALRTISSALTVANIGLISKMIYDGISDSRVKEKYSQEKIEKILKEIQKQNNS